MLLKELNHCKLKFFIVIFFICYSIAFNALASQDATSIPADIIALFPSATRVGPVESNIPVTPVYQLSQLLGYAFESDDFTNFIGFSGETINILIGIDTKGVLTGLKVIKHHEPIFIHGLGEEPMFEFISQYQGHSIKERFNINARNKSAIDTTYFDGITRATVSVLVINDTIITSALKVAREKLAGFVAPSHTIINPDYFEKLSFSELVSKNLIQHWKVNKEQAIAFAESTSTEVVSEIEEISAEENGFIDVYLAYINIPIIGKNLLSEEEYQRLQSSLKPGEHALMMFGNGKYSFVSEDFIPQTVPDRLSAEQNGVPVDIRDIDFYSYYEPHFALELPEYNEIRVFRIKSQSGFELNKEISLSMAIRYNASFLNTKQFKFSFDQTLPDHLFTHLKPQIDTEKNYPLWLKIWINRSIEIAILIIYLTFLMILFIKQKTIAQKPNFTHKLRLLSLVFVVAFVGFYSQGQLSVVNIYTLLLSLWQGFNIETFLLDPIIFILWVFVFISLFLWGRGLFCGWLCPFGALQEFAGLVAKKLKIKQIKIKPQHHKAAQKIKYVILLVLVGCSFYSLTLAEQLAEVEPFKTSITLNFVRYWPFVLYAVLLLLLSLKIHKVYCRYLCPLGGGLAIIGRFPLFKWLRRREECGSPCQLCRNKMCGIDAINQDGSIDYGECIQCLDCLVVIESPSLCVVNKYENRSKTNSKSKTITVVNVAP